MQSLPFEIIKDILSRLPVKSLMRFRCVSKDWRYLIHDPFFISQHLNRSSEKNPGLCLADGRFFTIILDGSSTATRVDIPFQGLVDRVEILGSCNGLLCLFVAERLSDWYRHINPIYLWNPARREYRKLPDAPFSSPRIWGISTTVLGFGYDSINNEYKVVRIIYFCERGMDRLIPKSDVRVYSLASVKWKKLGNAPFEIRDTSSKAVLNGFIHWMATRKIKSQMLELIVSFDVRNEVFREIHLPNGVGGECSNFVAVLGGCLSLIECIHGSYVEIWVMKDYGVNGSWTKQFTIELCSYGYGGSIKKLPIEILKSGEILIEKNSQKLVLYNPESKGERDLGIHGLPDQFSLFIFMESLVPLSVGSTYEEHQ
ncbi:F-box protein At3g07870-like [Macadamia integrifolia]|uniref:F-box protein At3g07870-like n=1 Tax=Macadamia integrifolia TaxID=60698 RepID=UPI001C52746F|nr:F-box protein At3g07870-like [Macadamia integrifolia]